MAVETENMLSDGNSGGGGGGNTGGAPGGSNIAFDPYTSPYLDQRRVFFTINTFSSLSRNGVLAKAFLNGVEIEDQTSAKGRITFSLSEQRLLNPSTLKLVSGDLKPLKYFIIQSRKDAQNEVSIIEFDTVEQPDTTDTNAGIGTDGGAVRTGGGGGGSVIDERTGEVITPNRPNSRAEQ